MHQQHMCSILLKVKQSAFTQGSFSSLSGISRVLGWPLNDPSSLGKQPASCESPHDWLMSLAMDLAALCDMCMEVKMAAMEVISLFLVKT